MSTALATVPAFDALACFERHGAHSQAFSTLRPTLQRFGTPSGYVAFQRALGVDLVLGDPVCAADTREPLLTAFLDAHPRACFVQTSEAVATLLHARFGYYATQIGSEITLDLSAWSLRGKQRQVIRTARNQAHARGIALREAAVSTATQALWRSWIATRRLGGRALDFMIRPPEAPCPPGARAFHAYDGPSPVGFIVFDPIRRDGKLVSYVPSISGASARLRQGAWYALMAHAIEVFQAEGVPELELGLVPLLVTPTPTPTESRLLRAFVPFLRRHVSSFYNFDGLAFAKSRFGGRARPAFFAHRGALPVRAIAALMRATRLI